MIALRDIKKQFFTGFKKRIVISYAIFLCVVAGSLITYGITTDRRMLRNQLEENGLYLVRNLATNSETGVYSEYMPFLSTPLEAILKETNTVWAAVYNLKGEDISFKAKEELNPAPLPDEIKESIRNWGNIEVKKKSVNLHGHEVLDFYTPIYLRKQPATDAEYGERPFPGKTEIIGIARVGISLEALTLRVREILYTGLILSVFYFIIGIGAILFIVREIARPVRRISDSAREIGKGNLHLRIQRGADDEIGMLADSFNQMAADLHMTIERLRSSEEEVRKRGDFLENLLDHANSIIIELDERRIVRRFNCFAEKLFGCSKEQVVGKPLTGSTLPDHVLDDSAGLSGHLGYKHFIEHVIKTGQGKEILISWISSPILDQQGKSVGTLLIGTDITDRKRIEDQLRQSQKMQAIGTLAGGIAHDFNNILGGIIGFSELARDAAIGKTDIQHYLDQILKAADRAKNLVKQILAFSRKTEYVRQPLQINLVIKDAFRLLRATIPSMVDIRVDIPDESYTVIADPTQLHQVLMNLCTNAAHAMEGSNGAIEIQLRPVQIAEEDLHGYANVQPGHYVQLSVKDTGSGISPDIIDRIFDPFFTTKGVGKGTGMGLAVVHGIIRSLNGDIKVYSEPGRGSIFHVFLPCVKESFLAESEKNDLLPQGTESILLVDDEEMLLDVGKRILSSLGYHITAFQNATEAYEAFKSSPAMFDIVVTDQTMPYMAGFDLAGRLMQIRPDIPIILCTGYSETVSEEVAAAAGIKAFVMKPLQREEIAVKVRNVLDSTKHA